ncbi:RTX calcium-binding nonapeptide repeat [Candidatus Methylopumilus planktonicus]|uniref:calcium-binding protein n=1 Tax=Candidatus Methylopumilus planktonicus TaxID=1581557 RepID=UPI003BEED3D6
MLKELVIDGSSRDFTFKKVALGDAREFFMVVPLNDDASIRPTPIAGYEVIVFNDRTINLNQTALGEMKPQSSSQSFINHFPLEPWHEIENPQHHDDDDALTLSQTSQNAPHPESRHGHPTNDVPENLGVIRNVTIHKEYRHPENHRENESPQSNKSSSPSRTPSKEKNGGANQDAQDTNVASALRQTNGDGGGVTPTPEPPAPIYNYAAQTFYGTPSLSSLTGDAGDDTFYSSSNVYLYQGNQGIDTLVGVDTSEASITQSSEGVFEIAGSAFDTVMNGQGNPSQQDTFQMSNVKIDSIEQFKNEANGMAINLAQLSLPTRFNDTIEALNRQESFVINLLAGDDRVTGGETDDTLLGNDGNDLLLGGTNTLIQNHHFYESLDGGNGNDTLTYLGVTNSNYVLGDSVSASLLGGNGNDDLQIKIDALSHVSISGGMGLDSLSINQSTNRYSLWDPLRFSWQFVLQDQSYLIKMLSLDTGNVFEITESDASLESIKLSFSSNATSYDILRPQFASPQTLIGTDGNDVFFSSNQTTNVSMGLGDDIVVASNHETISLGEGTNQLFASASDVTLSYAWASEEVDLNLSQKLGLAYDQDTNLIALDRINRLIENAEGGSGHDKMTGNILNNQLWGLSGNDTIVGGGGDDFIYGGDGNDMLTMNGQGNATLQGGEGSDQFKLHFNLTDGSKATITDFNADTLDHVFLYLDQFSTATGTYFNQYEIKDASQNLLYSGAIDHEGSAVLTLTLNQENNLLSVTYNQESYAILESTIYDIDLMFNHNLFDVSYL